MMTENIFDRSRDIHQRNVTAGWWSDLATGASILQTRNRPEMLMLTVSELSEAHEGLLTGCNDDKLPTLQMFPVELADAAIRNLDLIGAEESVHGELLDPLGLDFPKLMGDMLGNIYEVDGEHPVDSIMSVVDLVSAAMEHYRKRRIPEYRLQLIRILAGIFGLAYLHGIDNLWEIIDLKLAYNRDRADHKPENRKAEGGKAF